MLADLGQKYGVLRLLGKGALLWGGLRGAMSLTDRVLVFLKMSERPLHQRSDQPFFSQAFSTTLQLVFLGSRINLVSLGVYNNFSIARACNNSAGISLIDPPLDVCRLLGFVALSLLLWAPIFVPLIPSLLEQWSSQASGGVAGFAAVVGLYGAVVILITIWGRRIRGYEKPLVHYGLRITSPSKVTNSMCHVFCRGRQAGITCDI